MSLKSSFFRFVSRLNHKFPTLCVHGGSEIDDYSGAVNTPLYMSSTFVQPEPGVNAEADCMYGRYNNPSRNSLEKHLAELENGKFCHVSSAGIGAISSVLGTLEENDHVISIDDVFGGTRVLFENTFSKLGIRFSFVDLTDTEAFEEEFRENNTKLVFMETPTNPTLKITDIAQTVEITHSHDAILCVDNTFATPYNQNPLDLGADIVMHSCTKYINGHADVVMGANIVNDEELSEAIYNQMIQIGCTPSPFDCFLAQRGLKTLDIRMERIHKNSEQLSEFLESHPKVKSVIYPGLTSHPQHEIAKKNSKNNDVGFGGMISFYLEGDMEESHKFLTSLELVLLAVSLGGVETLCNHPALMTHRGVSEEVRKELNITNNLVRLSVGIEHIDDLILDIDQALSNI